MVLNYKGSDLETALIEGEYTYGVGNTVPDKVYGAIPDPAPGINGGGVFTPLTYGLADANANTVLKVTLEGATYINAATLMYQMSYIAKYITFNEKLPTDGEITSATNKYTLDIQKKSKELFDEFSKQSTENKSEQIEKDIEKIKQVITESPHF
ncbi:MAG: hypothetical protein WC376_01285 [Candidatus Nanoarchaeia archaeon]|jgi:hypothetical protein